MLSIRDIVTQINTKLSTVFTVGFKPYGIAKTVTRGAETLPSIDETYIGIDDINALQVYHKLNTINLTQKTNSGYGDDIYYNINTYRLSMIAFNNKKRTKLNDDELALIIQSAFPKIITSDYLSVRNTMTGVILNSQSIYAQEYKSERYRLDENQSLFQIEYNTEIIFKTDCLVLCPEDLTCKN